MIAPIKIRNNSIIGAGTVVDKNVNEGTVVYRKSELIKKNKKKVMCGIFGVLASEPVIKPILDGLSKLEYRGYDSSGISILDTNKNITTVRAKGKLTNLKNKLKGNKPKGKLGLDTQDGQLMEFLQLIMHTRIHPTMSRLFIMV